MEMRSVPAPAVDLSVFVLAAVDDHIAVFQRIRDRLDPGCLIAAGDRQSLAAASVAAATQYVLQMSSALATLAEPYPGFPSAAPPYRSPAGAGAPAVPGPQP